MKRVNWTVLLLLAIFGVAGAQVYNYFPPPGITYAPAAGMVLGSATGGAQGAGTLNMAGCYVNGVACGTGNSGITQLTGDVTAGPGSGSQTATVVQVEGAAIPPTAAVLGTNSSKQLVSAPTTGSGSAVLATSPTLVTPILGAASASSINGSTVPASAGTLPGSTGSFVINDCVKVGSIAPLTIADAGSACGSGGGGSAFSSLTSGVNTTAAMQVGAGASLVYTSTGIINANEILGTSITGTTGSGGTMVFSTSPTLTTPNLGTPSALNLANATNLQSSAIPATIAANTTGNAATATALASSTSQCSGSLSTGITTSGNANCSNVVGSPSGGSQGSGTLNAVDLYINGTAAGYLGTPANNQSGGYTLAASDRGNSVFDSSGTVTVPSGVFNQGDVVTVIAYGGNLSISPGSGLTLYWAVGSSSFTGTRTLTNVGIATIIFESSSVALITGSGIS